MKSSTDLTPMQVLRIRKAELTRECQEYEDRIVDTVGFVKTHSGSLLLGYVFGSVTSPSPRLASVGKKLIPIVWSFVQPMLLKVGIKKVLGLFFGRKKK